MSYEPAQPSGSASTGGQWQVVYLNEYRAWVSDGLGRSPHALKYTRAFFTASFSWSGDGAYEALWDGNTGQIRVGPPGQVGGRVLSGFGSVAFAPDSDLLAFDSRDGAATVIYDPTLDTSRILPGGGDVTGWSPDAQTVVLRSADGFAAVNVSTGARAPIPLPIDPNLVRQAEISPQGRLYTLSDTNPTVLRSENLDGSDPQVFATLPSTWGVWGFGFDTEGTVLVSHYSADGGLITALLEDGSTEERATLSDGVPSRITVKPSFTQPVDLCAHAHGTITGTTGDDVLHGTPGDDVILGLSGNDQIDGGGGDDIICGGEGDDTITGGPGNDHISGDRGDDTIDAGSGDDVVLGSFGRDTLLGGAGNDTITTYLSSDGGVESGGDGNDTIFGSRGADTITGDAGDDTITGVGAADIIDGGAGDDIIYGARRFGSSGSDVMYGGDGNDHLDAGSQMFGGAGDDTLTNAQSADAGAGNDTITLSTNYGFSGHVIGGPGNDLVTAHLLRQPVTMDLGSGDDHVWIQHAARGVSPSVIELGDGNDSALTSRDVDHVFGGPGDDALAAGAGNDLIDGGSGTDTCFGGLGFDRGRSCETITDIEVNRP